MVESVQAMCTKAVYPHETNFVFHILRQKLFAFEEFTNTTQEAPFAAVKFGPSAVTGSMDIHTSVKHLNIQAATKSVAYQATALSRLASTATWSTISSVLSKMVPHGGGLIEKEWNHSHNDYISGMFGPAEFGLSLVSGEAEEVSDSHFLSSFVPRFKYVRIVTVWLLVGPHYSLSVPVATSSDAESLVATCSMSGASTGKMVIHWQLTYIQCGTPTTRPTHLQSTRKDARIGCTGAFCKGISEMCCGSADPNGHSGSFRTYAASPPQPQYLVSGG
jgi:hypothetical protein